MSGDVAAGIQAGDGQDEGVGAGGQDDGIGMQGSEEGFVCFHVAAQIHAGLLAFDDEGADDFGDLTLAGGVSGDAEVAAQFQDASPAG